MQAGSSSASDHLDRAVFVAVVAVNEVQAAVHQVVHVPRMSSPRRRCTAFLSPCHVKPEHGSAPPVAWLCRSWAIPKSRPTTRQAKRSRPNGSTALL